MDQTAGPFLIVRAGALRCALPLSRVREVMRPLPLVEAQALPPGVLGASVVRGEPLPVVSLAHLTSQQDESFTRYVVLRTPGRDCVLAVSAIESIAALESEKWEQLPRLLENLQFVEQLAAADGELVATLDLARLVAALPPVEEPAP